MSNPDMHMPPRDSIIGESVFTFGHILYILPTYTISRSNDPILPLYIDDPGEFFCFPGGHFDPHLPLGYHAATGLEKHKATTNGELLIAYFDNSRGKLYITPIKITD